MTDTAAMTDAEFDAATVALFFASVICSLPPVRPPTLFSQS